MLPAEHARPLPGLDPVLAFLPKSTSSSSYQTNPQQTGPRHQKGTQTRDYAEGDMEGDWQDSLRQNISVSLRDPRAASLPREDMEWARTRTTTLLPLNSSQRDIKSTRPSLQKAVSNSIYNKGTLTQRPNACIPTEGAKHIWSDQSSFGLFGFFFNPVS